MKNILQRYSRHILIFLIFSFLGWLMETVSCFIMAGEYLDRGFLHLPFCTIYGFCILLMHALIGTPRSGGLLLGKVSSKGLRYICYILLSIAIPTAAELVTGLSFERLFGVRLWDYTWHRYDFMGYISLEMALVWGAAMWLILTVVYPNLEKLAAKIPGKIADAAAGVLSAAIAVDWVICCFGI